MATTTHFVLGDSAAGGVARAVSSAEIVVTRDLFTEGPCRFDGPSNLRQWLEARMRWWARLDPVQENSTADGNAALDALERASRSLRSATVWTADGTGEQLHLCWLAAVLPPGIEFRFRRPSRPPEPATGVGQCDPAQLRAAESHRLSNAERSGLAATWEAYVAQAPTTFFARVRESASPTHSLARLVDRFPDRVCGLTAWESRLLSRLVCHPEEPTAHTIGGVLRDYDGPDFIGDQTLFVRLHELARAGLLDRSGDGRHYATTRFEPTPLGLEVLAGSKNRVLATGFDRWVGGTHVRAANGELWWRDTDGLVPGSSVPSQRYAGH